MSAYTVSSALLAINSKNQAAAECRAIADDLIRRMERKQSRPDYNGSPWYWDIQAKPATLSAVAFALSRKFREA